MRARLLAAALAMPAALCLLTGPAAAQYCDNLEGQDVKVSGTIEKMVDAAGVLFFRDQKTACQFGLVLDRKETGSGCKTGGQIEASGKLIKNKFMPGTYDVDRDRKAGQVLVCR